MSRILTYKGQLEMGAEEKIHLSTNDGLTGYRIKNFNMISSTQGKNSAEYVGQIFLKSQAATITDAVDFSNTDLLAVDFLNHDTNPAYVSSQLIIFDNETFNQDIFVYIVDASGNTVPCNYYLELEQFKIDLNTSTFHTLKNIRSTTQ